MRAVATAPVAIQTAAKHQAVVSRSLPAPVVPISTMHNEGALLQRKDNCACGGGCPSCSDEAAAIQTKLTVSSPGDEFEQEADRVAEQVMRAPSSSGVRGAVHRRNLSLSRHSARSTAPSRDAPPGVNEVLRSPGQPLEGSSRSFMQSRFGRDFAPVRVHADSHAAESASSVSARAYTVGNHIVFAAGEYRPETNDGRILLAHELTHTVQQTGSHREIQRVPVRTIGDSEDSIHSPLLDAFSQETGVPRESASQHSPEYEAWLLGGHYARVGASPVQILNNEPYTSSLYSSTVSGWPNDLPIWQGLTTPRARTNFVRFILSFDETNCVRYSASDTTSRPNCSATASAVASFSNACQGYASQMYSRYTSAGRLPAADTAALQSEAHINVGSVPAKFQIPIRIATVPGHAFNAVLIGSDAAQIDSWLFFEPQTDDVFFASDPRMTSVTDIYGGRGIFSLSTLTGYSHGFQQTTERSFLSTSAGAFRNQVLSTSQRIFFDNFLRDVFIADDAAAFPFYTSRHNPPQTYEQLISLTYASQPLADLAMAFTVINGRAFRRTPGGTTQIMDRDLYLQLLNRPGLEALIQLRSLIPN